MLKVGGCVLRQAFPGGPIICQGKGTCLSWPQPLSSQVCLSKSLRFSVPLICEPWPLQLAFDTRF